MMVRALSRFALALALGLALALAGCGECPAMDVAGEGECDAFFGYAWSGDACVGVSGCSCVGEDCDATYQDRDACEQAFAGC